LGWTGLLIAVATIVGAFAQLALGQEVEPLDTAAFDAALIWTTATSIVLMVQCPARQPIPA
jgi:hypothetical protein